MRGRAATPSSSTRHRAHVEAAPLDRRILEHRALARVEPVDARGEHRLDARRQRAGRRLRAHCHELLEEQRVALGRLDDPRRRAATRAHPGGVSTSSRARPRSRAPRAPEATGSAAAPPRPGGSRAARAARGRAAGSGAPLENATRYSSRSSRVGSAQWTSSTTTTSGRSRATRSSSRRTAQSLLRLRGSVGQPDRGEHEPRDASSPSSSSSTRRAASPAELADDLGERAGRSRPRRRTGSGRPRRSASPASSPTSSRASRDLPIPAGPTTVTARQARSPRGRRTPRGARSSSRTRPTNGLAAARAPTPLRGSSSSNRHAWTFAGAALAARAARAARRARRPDEAVDVLAEQDLALAARLPSSRGGDVERVSGRERATAACRRREHLARLDAELHRDPDAALALQLGARARRPPRAARRRPAPRAARRPRGSSVRPKTPTTASPMNPSTVPPWRSITAPQTAE